MNCMLQLEGLYEENTKHVRSLTVNAVPFEVSVRSNENARFNAFSFSTWFLCLRRPGRVPAYLPYMYARRGLLRVPYKYNNVP